MEPFLVPLIHRTFYDATAAVGRAAAIASEQNERVSECARAHHPRHIICKREEIKISELSRYRKSVRRCATPCNRCLIYSVTFGVT